MCDIVESLVAFAVVGLNATLVLARQIPQDFMQVSICIRISVRSKSMNMMPAYLETVAQVDFEGQLW